eukprot:s808_g2.t1
MSISEGQSSSEESMDCKDSRDKQKGRGQNPKLEFGPSKLEVVREEETTKKAAAKKKQAAEKKAAKKAAAQNASAASSSSSTAPAPNATTSLDQREQAAPQPLAQREALKPEIAIDHHNVLEVHGHIYPQSIRSLDLLREMGYKVHLVSFCGEERFRKVQKEARGAWEHWESICRTEERVGIGGKTQYLLQMGISVLFDDTASILQEALLKGIRVYPITTRHENHMWNKANQPEGGPYCHRYLQDAINKFLVDEKMLKKKQWQPKQET